jgi:hypothetical protein
LGLIIINPLQPGQDDLQGNENIQYLLQGDNEVFMLNPQEEAPVEAADDLLIDQLEVIPPPQGSPIYLMVEGVPLDQLIDPENEAIPD